jgi:hypothetical protein
VVVSDVIERRLQLARFGKSGVVMSQGAVDLNTGDDDDEDGWNGNKNFWAGTGVTKFTGG